MFNIFKKKPEPTEIKPEAVAVPEIAAPAIEETKPEMAENTPKEAELSFAQRLKQSLPKRGNNYLVN